MSDRQIHINRAGQPSGPYPEAQAREMLASGQLLATDLAWFSGAAEWKPVGEVLGAAPAPAAAAPPPPPPPSGGGTSKPSGGGMPKRQVAGGKPEEKKEAEGDGEGDGEGDDPDKIHVTRKGEPIGPYSREKAREYFEAGTLLPTDWAWHDGMGEDWKPINEVLGLPVPGGAGGGAASDGPWTIGGSISEGWQTFKGNLGGAILFYFLGAIVLTITSSIPILNPFVFIPVSAGFTYYFIKLARRESVAIGDLFSGFKRGYGQLLLVWLLMGLIWLVATLPGLSVILFAAVGFIVDLVGACQDTVAGKLEGDAFVAEWKGVGNSFKAAGAGLYGGFALMLLVPLIALSFTLFSLPLVIDRQMKAIDAIVVSARLLKGQWFKSVFFLILIFIISGLGQIVFLIGQLFTGPLGMAAWASFYTKNAGSITAAHSAPVAKGVKIGLVCACLLPVGGMVAAVMMNMDGIKQIVGDANGTDANGTDAGDIETEVVGSYMVGDTGKGSRNGRPKIKIMEFNEGGFGNLTDPFIPNKRDGFKWSVNPENKGQIIVEPESAPPPVAGNPPAPPTGNPPPAPQKMIFEYIPDVGMKSVEADGQAAPKTLMLRMDKIVGQYVANSATMKGRLVLNANRSAELWVNGNKTFDGKWYVSGGAEGTPSEIWFSVSGKYHLILSVDTAQQPFSLKSVANLVYNEATKKINRFPSPPQGQLTYTRSKGGGGGSGPGQEPGMEPGPGAGLDGQ
ncbi:MAG: GYF domain-containing protein [Verrucomicrobiota bacterium]|nr:GYF domain-containing protein [Verrucomicrobiota bacterium]